MDQHYLPHDYQIERLASAWLGIISKQFPEQNQQTEHLDLIFNAHLARITANISPAAFSNAYFDWLNHLQLSPAKQAQLLRIAVEKYCRWQLYVCSAISTSRDDCGDTSHCMIHPLPQDKRFKDPAWNHWPFNVISQGFLLQQQWWHRATTDVRGVSRHHEDVVTFTTRQILDMLAPSNFLWSNPVALERTRSSHGMNLISGAQNALVDFQHTLLPETNSQIGSALACTAGKVVFRNHLIELIQYSPKTEQTRQRPLLVVPAWIMKYYILDLSPGNSLVSYLVEDGFTVFMISWKNPAASDRDLAMEDYRQSGCMAALEAISAIIPTEKINALGYCLGGTLLAICAASMAREQDARLASITLLASQVDFTEPGELSLFIDESQINFLEASMWDQGYLDTKQMAGAFQLLRSNDLIWSRRLNQYLLGVSEQGSDLMAWNADATRMPYRMHSDYLRQLFLHNDLAQGRYLTDGRPIALTDIHQPIFAVGTLTDHVAPWRSVFKIHLLSDTEVSFLLTSGGHNAGVISPPDHPNRSYQFTTHAQNAAYIDADSWQKNTPIHQGSWWPLWREWLHNHSGEKMSAAPMGPDLGDAPGTYVHQK